MRIYLITYDLQKPGKDYNSLYEAIKECGSEYYHALESIWLVATPEESGVNAKDIYKSIRQHIDSNDRLYIVRVDTLDEQGWLGKSVWNWIKEVRDK